MKTYLIALVLTLSGCTHSSVYEVVARELVAAEVENGVGYAGSWRPIGLEGHAQLTLAQKQTFQIAIHGCIDELGAQADEFMGEKEEPSASIATAQLLLCMRAKGWELTIDGVVSA